jgi:tRNA pseudouridine55 synthase
LYKLARKGQEVEREPRPVRVTRHEVTRIELPEVDFVVACSKGFYVRTYAHDIGEWLGCGGHLAALRRTRSGRFTLERAVTVEALKTLPREALLRAMVSLAEVSLMRGA